ncbi:hypothetical protein PC115_g8746 [Phytophthora cactorum]|uniref:Uncharacterized protein n=1 Tax=Phytophthora cactorum TaxID=29920 RepID=A0A8T1CIK9_9STRA|nr:hypothetical protein PC115_g8746 [Phytophthora cactorum]
MKSTVSLFAAAVIAATGWLTQVQAHGYMLIPLTEFKGAATGAWIVQIAPQFQANWESVVNDDELIALYVEKVKEAGYANNIRKRLDSDTNLYGDPPSDGTATIERGLAHHGPCEIWLDDTLALHNDDCAKAFSVKDYMSIKSVFKPVDYSSCLPSGYIRTASLCRRSNQYCRYRDRQGDPVGGHKPDDHVVEGDTGSTNPHYEFIIDRTPHFKQSANGCPNGRNSDH